MSDLMTNEEAIDLLDNLLGMIDDSQGNDYDAAFKLGIKALAIIQPCEDVISREHLLSEIEKLKQSPWYNDKRGNGFEYLIHEAVETVCDLCIKQEPSVQPINRWIPVSEKLPENRNQEVLISLEWGIDIGKYSDGEWHSEWINHYDDGNVLAWMPLPKPYEPQESED